jgi:leader peptidase (prepilin peptidase)/N-methyltransferase
MGWTEYMPITFWCIWVFILGLIIGSFLNVLIARLPYEKSIIWPSSRCFSCFQAIRLTDNLPIIGYLRLRGKCRNCGAEFSNRYLWVELGTGMGFLALFIFEIVLNWQEIPALKFNWLAKDFTIPPWRFWAFFAYHAFLLSGLIAAAVIDAEHRIIPTLIPYVGVIVGVIGGALLPWPWPNPAAIAGVMPHDRPWSLSDYWGMIPLGLQPWPFWGPTFKYLPPGSFQIGLVTAMFGALAGSLVVRLIKWLFEVGFGREAMGLGDADLLMMAGAFLGWQVAVLSLFVAAPTALILKLLGLLIAPAPTESTPPAPAAQGTRELPFGPGLALGIVVTWFAWRWLGPRVQFVFFDMIAFGLATAVMCIGMVAAGLLLRRPDESQAPQKVP